MPRLDNSDGGSSNRAAVPRPPALVSTRSQERAEVREAKTGRPAEAPASSRRSSSRRRTVRAAGPVTRREVRLANPLGTIAGATRAATAGEALRQTAEQKAEERSFFSKVREHVDAGAYNVATFRPTSLLIPENPVEAFVPVARAPIVDYAKGFITGERNPAPERKLGDVPEAGDYTLAEVVVEGVGGLVAGIATGTGGGVKDAYLDPVGSAIVQKAQALLGDVKASAADQEAARAREEERLEIREAKTGRPQDARGRASALLDAQAAKARGLLAPLAPGVDGAGKKDAEAHAEGDVGGGLLGERGAVDGGGNGGAGKGETKPRAVSHGGALAVGGLLGSATAGVVAAGSALKSRAKAATVPRAPTVPAVPVPSLPSPTGVPSMETSLLGQTSSGLLGTAAGKVQAAVQENKAALLGAAAGTALLGGVVATGVAVARSRSSSRSSSKRASSKRAAKSRAKGLRHSHAREDRSGRVVTKKTYRGKKVYWTKKGQPYVYQKDGRPRFIPR